MRRALVTGGGGFIGSHLSRELLAHDYDVVSFGHGEFEVPGVGYLRGDIRDERAVAEAVAEADVVFHLAGLLGTTYVDVGSVADFITVNVLGAVHVFQAAQASGARVVNVGLVPDWLNAYMITKKTAARFGRMYHQLFETDVITCEITHVYGPGQPTRPYAKAIPTFITHALRGEPLLIYGSGQRLMDCVFVEDAVRGLRLAADRPDFAGEVIEMSSGSTISVVALAEKIIDLTGSSSVITFAPMRLGEPAKVAEDESIARETSARTVLGWTAATPLDDGLRLTIEHFARNLSSTREGV